MAYSESVATVQIMIVTYRNYRYLNEYLSGASHSNVLFNYDRQLWYMNYQIKKQHLYSISFFPFDVFDLFSNPTSFFPILDLVLFQCLSITKEQVDVA